MPDPYRLKRFTDAQDTGLYSQALAELRQGRKLSHWIWFVFPQIAGLGSSPMAVEYAISDLDEARAYLGKDEQVELDSSFIRVDCSDSDGKMLEQNKT